MKTTTIDQFLTEYALDSRHRSYKDIGYLNTLATELSALLAERDRLAGEVTEWEGHAQTYEAGMVAAQRELAALKAPTPSRRLREYKGVTYRDGRWHIAEMPFDNAFTLMYWYSEFVDADHAALLALRDDPYEKVETLEAVLEAWANATRDGVHSVELSDLEHRLRAWLATQPNTPSDAKHVGAALVDSEKQTITPEQAVAVLEAHGGKKERLNDVWHCSRISEREKYVLILPTATPERGT